ncbi:AvrD family protein [Mycobacterium sp. PDNC021]|uniref:AvrD family protein n=1 Tax=Mycobacterium sp. PDNC021 TaxID=3391399 RepID=UPI003AAB6B12
MTTTPINADTVPSVDVFLGPAEKRFFGHGYRRIHYELGPPAAAPAAGAATQFRASIRCPANWSTKADGDQRPHLSTIDALLLGQWATEIAARTTLGVAPATIETWAVESVTIHAGKTPIEDLTDIDVTTTAAGSDDRTSTWQVTVGNMRLSFLLRQHVHHSAVLPRRGHGEPSELTDVVIDTAAHNSRATLTAGTPVDLIPESRLGRRLAVDGRPSLVDAFVATLQLGQVLLYELDHMSRGQSNTLWMRQTTLTVAVPNILSPNESHDMAVHLDRIQRLELGGAHWRTADVVGAVAGMTVRCAVAHQLPPK